MRARLIVSTIGSGGTVLTLGAATPDALRELVSEGIEILSPEPGETPTF